MAMTIRELLNTKPLNSAEIRAGASSLDRTVFSVVQELSDCEPGSLFVTERTCYDFGSVVKECPYLSAVIIPMSSAYQGEEGGVPVLAVKDPGKIIGSLAVEKTSLTAEIVSALIEKNVHKTADVLNEFHASDGHAFYLMRAKDGSLLSSTAPISNTALARLMKQWKRNGLPSVQIEGEDCVLLSNDPCFDVYRLKTQAISLAAVVNAGRSMYSGTAIASLIHAGEIIAARLIAREAGFPVPEQCDIWLLLGDRGMNVKPWIRSIREFCSNFARVYLLEETENNLIIVLDKADNLKKELQNANSLSEYCMRSGMPVTLVRTNDSTGHLGNLKTLFRLAERLVDTIRIVFLSAGYFSVSDLRMVEMCQQIIAENGPELRRYREMLECLTVASGDTDLCETLAVYYLDQKMSVTETASVMYVHRNTIKYRIQKAEDILGLDSGNVMDIAELVKALVIDRML